MTSYVGKYSQKRPQVCAGVVDKMISSFSPTAQMRPKKVMTSSFMTSYFRKIFHFAIIAVIDKGKFFTQI